MKKLFIIIGLVVGMASYAAEPEYDHIIFENAQIDGPYFFSKADYTGNSYINHSQHHLQTSTDKAFTPKNSLLLHYVSAVNGDWSAMVFFPRLRGKDFIKASKYLDLRILIDTPDTQIEGLPKVAIGMNSRRDTLLSQYVDMGKYIKGGTRGQWQQVRIPLSDFTGFTYDRTQLISIVAFKQANTDGKDHVVYIDQIELTPELVSTATLAAPKGLQAKGYERHVDLQWDKAGLETAKYVKIYRSTDGRTFQAVGIQDPLRGRYADYTGEPNKTLTYKIVALDATYNESSASQVVSATTHPMTDDELLDMVQEASFRYYWDGAEPNSGLALENIPGRRNMIAAGASGFGIMAIVTAVERGFITREQAVERLVKITTYLGKADRFHGAFAHFMDGITGKVEPFFGNRDNGADMIETAFLYQGLLTARQYFDRDTKEEKQIRASITKLWQGVEWDWYKQTKDSKYLYWHWSPDQAWVINHKFIGWNESMIVYLLAMASPTHGVDKSMYYTGWASQEEEAQNYRSSWGRTKEGSMYTNGNTYYGVKLEVGVSSGGPLFFIHYSYMGFDPHSIKDKYVSTNYFDVFRDMALINHRYCIENPKKQIGYGPDCWGLTASDGPWRYHAAEPAVRQDDGTMAPTGALASFPYTPEQSMAALKNYYRNYGSFLWGEYGFRDAFNLTQNWCASIFMGLNQAPVTVMIENYRSGLIWKLFMSNPEIQKMVGNAFPK